jgi:hypothetical protein
LLDDIVGGDHDHPTSGAANTIFIHKVQWSFMPVRSTLAEEQAPTAGVNAASAEGFPRNWRKAGKPGRAGRGSLHGRQSCRARNAGNSPPQCQRGLSTIGAFRAGLIFG